MGRVRDHVAAARQLLHSAKMSLECAARHVRDAQRLSNEPDPEIESALKSINVARLEVADARHKL